MNDRAIFVLIFFGLVLHTMALATAAVASGLTMEGGGHAAAGLVAAFATGVATVVMLYQLRRLEAQCSGPVFVRVRVVRIDAVTAPPGGFA